MARYATEHKAETRRRIVAAAGRRFKQDGIDGSGISTLMGDAGLTNGAFYAHFSSKDDLIAQAIADQLQDQLVTLQNLPPGDAALADYIRNYLSPQHRDEPSAGCPSAALLDEICRCDDAARNAYTRGVKAIVGEIAARLSSAETADSRTPADTQTTALGMFTTLVATLQLARAVNDVSLSSDVLNSGIRNAIALLDAQPDLPAGLR